MKKTIPFLTFSVFSLVSLTAKAEPLPSWALGPFVRPEGGQPIIKPNPDSVFTDPITQQQVHWEKLHTFNPAAVVRNGKVYVIYRAEDDSGEMAIALHTSRLGMAVSEDGVNFTKMPAPVFYPDNDDQKKNETPGGTEDPRIIEREDGTYVLTYTQWNRQSWRVGVATSKDLVHWTKHGQALQQAFGGKFNDWYKSAGIVTKVSGGRLKAAKINGKYWMYWGEGIIRVASSTDCINWTPGLDGEGKIPALIGPRRGQFDSTLAEVGPPPILTKKGIVMLYNGKNSGGDAGDPSLGEGAYAVGQALFDARAPSKLLARTDGPFFKPELPFEKTGQYASGTTFAEGLVLFKKKWFLYYGCADSLVGVAISK